MRLTYKDALATLFVAAIVVPYLGYLANGSMPFIQDARGMAGIGLVLGLAACTVGGQVTSAQDMAHRIESVLGPCALALGVATLITESGPLLAVFIATIVALWAMTTLHHAG